MRKPEDTAAGARSGSPPGPYELTVTVREAPEAVIVSVVGELDLLTAPHLEAELDAVLAGQATNVVIDLSQTTFMDSCGIHVLVSLRRRLRRHSLAVICGPGPVRRTLELMRLTAVLSVVSSYEEYRQQGGAS